MYQGSLSPHRVQKQLFLVLILLFFPLQIKDILKPEVTEEIVLEARQRLLDLEG